MDSDPHFSTGLNPNADMYIMIADLTHCMDVSMDGQVDNQYHSWLVLSVELIRGIYFDFIIPSLSSVAFPSKNDLKKVYMKKKLKRHKEKYMDKRPNPC